MHLTPLVLSEDGIISLDLVSADKVTPMGWEQVPCPSCGRWCWLTLLAKDNIAIWKATGMYTGCAAVNQRGQ